MRVILAHGEWWQEWHHLLPYLPAVAGAGIAGAMGWLNGYWSSRIAMAISAIAFLVFGFAIDGISEIGHHLGFIGAGFFAGRLVSIKREL